MARHAYTINSEQTDGAKTLASAIVATGAGALLDNADGVEMRLVQAGDTSLPVAVCASGYKRAAFLSPIRHYLSYPIEEIAKRSRLWSTGRLGAALWPLYLVMRMGEMDRVVYPNHWLTVSRPPLGLDRRGVDAIIAELVRTCPDHAIVFSNVVPALSRKNYDDLISAGCDMVPSRRIWIFDSRRPTAGKEFRNIRMSLNRERRYLENAENRRITDRDTLRSHVLHMTALCRSLNTEKHSRLNPQYTAEFFRVMLDNDLIESTGWYGLDGELEAFLIQMTDPSNILWSLAGYDPRWSRERRLTRLVSAYHIASVRKTRGVFQWGGGADQYKFNRGAVPAQEFDAVYTAHLSYRRRLPWRLLSCVRGIKAPLEIRWDKGRRSRFEHDTLVHGDRNDLA